MCSRCWARLSGFIADSSSSFAGLQAMSGCAGSYVKATPNAVLKRPNIRRPLLLPLPDQQVETHHAVLVANSLYGVFGIDVVLELNDLLCRLRQISDVRQRHIVRNLLLDGKARAWIVVGSSHRRIDADRTHTKQSRNPITYGLVDELSQHKAAGSLA